MQNDNVSKSELEKENKIESALKELARWAEKYAPSKNDDKQTVRGSPREVFMYLFATIALYSSAWSVINLFLEYINVKFPDPLNPYYDAGNSIRWALALVIIIFPAYFFVSRFLHKELVGNPGKSEIKIRKWLLYFTLFVAALLIAGDLVALIYNFLQGEFTTRFLLKVLAILAVAAAVFWYYLYDLRKGVGGFSSGAKWFVRGVIVVVAVIVIAGFFVAGSPFKQRLVKFDDQKVSDLETLQGKIINYWTLKYVLPNSLDDLKDNISGFTPPLDPQNGGGYEYNPTGKLSFELCANFNLSSDARRVGALRAGPAVASNEPVAASPVGSTGNDNWNHGTGRVCFTRVIDPMLYRQKPLSAQ